jgi:hypothetical protein
MRRLPLLFFHRIPEELEEDPELPEDEEEDDEPYPPDELEELMPGC